MLFQENIPTHYIQPMYLPMSPPPQNPTSRKRPAPGSVPIPPTQPYHPPNCNQQMHGWNGNKSANFVDNSANSASFGMMSPTTPGQYGGQPAGLQLPSTVLARRDMNNQLVAANRPYSPQQNDPWNNFPGEDHLMVQPNGNITIDEHDNIEVLEEKASRAKREAQAKRKQIPPFVQKLNSFLEESKNTELIRWSEKGDSFIVLDEDEFAKTLIPELFKHNNYASFVRQLNMYGFHKKVGLSDNSMKASERKNKSPSEYYNPYFRRGHPNLLWLINKPKSGGSKKKGKRLEDCGDPESDDEIVGDEAVTQNFAQHPAVPTRALPAPDSGGPLQKKEMTVVREQMLVLQDQQKQIGAAIERLHREHLQMSKQAIAFQDMHNRHENSINAILHFLANVFRKSLEEQGGTQNVNDILASIMNPGLQMPQNHQGSVVDLGEYVTQQTEPAPSNTPPPQKRQQRLLPPIPEQAQGAVRSPPAGVTPGPYGNAHQVTELFDTPTESASSPSYLKQELEANPQEGMMKIIQDANFNAAKGNSPINMPNVAATTPTTMPEDQRSRMLSIMSGGAGNATSPPVTSGFNAPLPVDPTPSIPTAPATSLSPIIGSSVPPPSLQRLSATQEELEALQRLQREQSQKLDDLSSLLSQYSPSGKVPGLVDGTNTYFDENIDFGEYLDPMAYNANGTGAIDFDFSTPAFADNSAFEFNSDGLNPEFGVVNTGTVAGQIYETNTPSQVRTPSSNGTEEIPRDDLVLEDSPGRATKRQRKG